MKKYYSINNKSFEDLGVTTEKELWEKVKGEYEALSISVETIFSKTAESDNQFHVIFSTASVDRHGEIVMQNWDLKYFKKNAVFLDSHNYNSIEHILGKVKKIGIKEDKLQGDVEFCLDNPKGLLAYKMALGGFLSATSVGFIPLQFDDKGNILKSELLEISAVSVPANAEALFEKKEIGEVETKKEGDPCEMDDGEMGEMHPDGSGQMVCTPKKKKEEGAEIEEKIVTTKKKGIIELLAIKAKEDYQRLKRIADELEKTSPDNLAQRKRAIYKDLRILLTSKDNSVVEPS